MEVIEAIYKRRSIGPMRADAVSQELIEQLLSAAVQAPNHYQVRPWRFVVLRGEARSRLGQVMADNLQRKYPQLDTAALDKERSKPLRAPLLIAVGVDQARDERASEIENICAAAAACENMLLAAESLGLAVHWRTGDAARDPAIKRFLGFSVDQNVIAFLYVGYPESQPAPRERPGFEDRTTWMQ